jgi:lipopolysaccharide transport system ATP-binding protein
MSDITLRFDHVWKRFTKGEVHDSLRDLIPAIFKSTMGVGKRSRHQDEEFWAISDLSFEVKRGEALAIIGPNGSGKSTTLKLLSRILKPNAGSIMVAGRMSALIEVTAGFHPDLTGRENVFLNGTIFGMRRNEIEARMDEIIEFSGVREFIDTPVKRYSSGMYARLGFSIAAHVNPEILLVDEVLSVGDFTFQGKCIRHMQNILQNGTTVVFVSHNMESVLSLCHRAILLKQGKVASEGPPAAVIKDYYRSGGVWTPEVPENNTAQIERIENKADAAVDGAAHQGDHHQYQLSIIANDSCRLSPGMFLARDGMVVFDTTYGRMTSNVMTLEKGQVAKLTWDIDLNLPAGVYDLGFHLEDADHPNKYQQYIRNYRTLVVSEDRRYEAQYYLNPSVTLEM